MALTGPEQINFLGTISHSADNFDGKLLASAALSTFPTNRKSTVPQNWFVQVHFVLLKERGVVQLGLEKTVGVATSTREGVL